MKRWEIEGILEDVKGFSKSDACLEQYATSAEIAASTVSAMEDGYGDVKGRLMTDLGCGTGMLSIASVLHGAAFVIGADIDEDALHTAQNNVGNVLDCAWSGLIDFVRADVGASAFLRDGCVDSGIMNPPFGTKRAGVDVVFLARAVKAAREAVYSMHKTSTRDYLARKTASWGASPSKVIAQVRFDIANTLDFHKRESVDVHVDVWRVDVSNVAAEDVKCGDVETGMGCRGKGVRGRRGYGGKGRRGRR